MTSEAGSPPSIYVLAGTNGAGKSSIAGAAFRRRGADYYNPDDAARRILAANRGLGLSDANSAAWFQGKRLLERAIEERLQFAFETTLGGNTIPRLLERALDAGIQLHVWYVGLNSAELHIARVRERVVRGGHDIPEAKIRERFDSSRINLIRLLSRLTELRVYDNSEDANPALGVPPRPRLILHVREGVVLESCGLEDVPGWAKPVVMAAFRTPRQE